MAGERDSVTAFKRDLDEYARALEIGTDVLMKKLVYDVFADIVNETPVDTGAARGNWTATRGARPPFRSSTYTGGAKGADAANAGPATAHAFGTLTRVSFTDAAGDVFWLSNFLPYISLLEFGGYPEGPGTVGGFSRKTPRPFVRTAVARARANLDRQYSKALRDQGLRRL